MFSCHLRSFLTKHLQLADEYLTIGYFLPRDASAERGNATVSRPSVCDVQVSATYRLEFFENNFTAE